MEVSRHLSELIVVLDPQFPRHELAGLLLPRHVPPDALEHGRVRGRGFVEAPAVGLDQLARCEDGVVQVERLLGHLGNEPVPERALNLETLAAHEQLGLLHVEFDGRLRQVGVRVRVHHVEGDSVGVGGQHWDGDVALAGIRVRLWIGEVRCGAPREGPDEEEARGVHQPRLGRGEHRDGETWPAGRLEHVREPPVGEAVVPVEALAEHASVRVLEEEDRVAHRPVLHEIIRIELVHEARVAVEHHPRREGLVPREVDGGAGSGRGGCGGGARGASARHGCAARIRPVIRPPS
mmetsp:Transcript_19524/g.62164  ORF Transcript_19524/g.62164 Transcript_19524/m.62164 type:complete len:293 (-) Transcript_19524:26-904(-)